MGSKQTTMFVEGMTCSACEARIESALRKIDGVTKAKASLGGGIVLAEYEDGKTGIEAMKAAVEGAGYVVKLKKGSAETTVAIGIGVLLAAAYLIASQAGLFNSLPAMDASIGFGMLFVVGLLTSMHCVAMCGGIALSQSLLAAPGDRSKASPGGLARLGPGLMYNGGRLISYTMLGGIVGALGSAFSFSPLAKGLIAGAAGLFMIFLGLRTLGIIPASSRKSRLVPLRIRSAVDRFGASFRSRGPFAIGLLNGLMPCGPLQTMQLYALGTGSAFAGALSMFIFGAGTFPLMLIFGLAASLLPRRLVPVIARASAVLVMFLGVVTFARAAALAGIPLPELPSLLPRASLAAKGAIRGAILAGDRSTSAGGILKAKVEGGVQTVLTEFGPNGYVPFVVQAGVPLKWTIRVAAEDLNGCNNPIIVPSYGLEKELLPGDNLVEFTPEKAGIIPYSCWMGMITSKIRVVPDLGESVEIPPDSANPEELLLPGGASGGASGGANGGCCSGTSNPAFAGGKVPVDSIGLPTIKDGVQEIQIRVNAAGYSPAAILLQKGMKAIIKFKPEQIGSCNNPVLFPEYNGALDLSKGELETPPIPIVADFTFQCWMGMLHGYVKAVDDLSKVDMNKIRAEIGAYRATLSGGCCGGGAAKAN
jgi:sulfite exporter TauE/SafE/plastocyanin domain-containing protein/copper chaperone CopZ